MILKILIFSLIIHTSFGSKILFLAPHGTRSETVLFKEIVKSLSDRNHSITWVTPTLYKDLPEKLVKQIHLMSSEELIEGFTNPLFVRQAMNEFYNQITRPFMDFEQIYGFCDRIYGEPEFLQLINEKFDLIIISGIVNNCYMGLVHVLKTPFIILTSTVPTNFLSMRLGTYMPPSTVPNTFLLHGHGEMDFFQRYTNTMVDWASNIYHNYISAPKYEAIYRKHLGQHLPSLHDIESNASLILSSSHFTSHPVKPLLPDFIEIGGAHCRPPVDLPQDLKEFADGASEHGLVYFSLGSIIKSTELPQEFRQMFLNVFSRLKQRVIWKWENGEMDGEIPKNIKLVKWAPQQDILGHKNTKLFITHGGLLSTQEAIYHGVPLLGFPIFFDQDANLAKAQHSGFAISLEIIGLTEKVLEENVKKILENPKYFIAAKKLSNQFKDQPESPIERAMYWIEYVIRHNGAPHLRSASRKLNFFQNQSYDVIGFNFLLIWIFYKVSTFILGVLYSRLFKSNEKLKQS